MPSPRLTLAPVKVYRTGAGGHDTTYGPTWDNGISLVGGVTPTAGGLVFFGDVGGNFYAVDAATGQKLWGRKIGGGIGGGVITYSVNGVQKVAVATGFISPVWPVEIRSSKVAILGIEGAPAGR